jgi:hypothetical protein
MRRPPSRLSGVALDLFAAIAQQSIARVNGAYETPFPLEFDVLVQRIRVERGEALAALRELLKRRLVRCADEGVAPASERRPITARPRSRAPSPFAAVAAALAPSPPVATARASRSSTRAPQRRSIPSAFAAVAAALAPSPHARMTDAPASEVEDATSSTDPLPLPDIRARLSRAQIASSGWTRVDPRPWTKLHARWRHPAGWRLEHCGHPTALNPWALYAPTGEMVLTGALYATPPNPRYGTAWHTLAEVIPFVADVLAGRRVVPGLSPTRTSRAPARRTRSPFAAAASSLGGDT